MQYRIKFFSDFCSSETIASSYAIAGLAETLSFYGKNKEIYFTNDDDYTHAIIINKAMPVLKIPKDRVIGLAQEPIQFLQLTDEFVEYAKKYIGKYFVGDKYNLPEPFVQDNAFIMYDAPKPHPLPKNKFMSIMISQKEFAPGHIYRHRLVEAILRTELPIDIYGRGCYKYNDPRIKGAFDKYEPYLDYDFHIAIENYQCNHYFSEKIINTLLAETTPIYLGCKNIDKYFKDDIIKLTGNLDIDMNTLHMIYFSPETYKKNINVSLIDDKVNLLKNIQQLFA